jgi:GNAT superfamily N-acetyltransferase
MEPEPVGSVVIRLARAGDVGQMVELLAYGVLGGDPQLDTPDLGPYEAALVEIDATDGCEVLVAELDGAVVGMCQLIMFRHLQSSGGRCAEIESMHVHPDWRSHGVGGELLEATVARASAAGCYRVQLTSNKARNEAHRFYERHGFVASHEGFKRLL